MIVVLHGADELGIHRHIANLKGRVGETREEVQTNLTTLEGRTATAHEILGSAMSPPFLAAKRMVLVERLLDRYEGTRGGKGSRSLAPLEPLFEAIQGGMPPTTILVITGGKLEARKGNALLQRLKELPGCEIVEYPELRGKALERHIREEAGLRGIKLRPGPSTRRFAEGEEWRQPKEKDPAELLAALHPGDTLALAQELDKLALYTRGREATVDDVAVVCAGERVFSVFQLTDAVMDGNYRLARSAYQALDEAGENPQGMLAMLASSYRRLATVVELLEEGASDDKLASSIPGGRFPNLLKAAKRRAQRHGWDGIRAAYAAIVETDRLHKSGEMAEDLAMETLIARLSSIAPASAQPSRRGQG